MLQTAVFPTAGPSQPIRQQHRFGGYLLSPNLSNSKDFDYDIEDRTLASAGAEG